MSDYSGQCFCHPTVDDCRHCNRARMWVERDVLTLANEIGELALQREAEIENLWQPVCPECGEPTHEADDEDLACNSCEWAGDGHEAETQPQEILQWFAVSTWLYEKLLRHDEPVVQFLGLYLWGRTCCGQSIELDGTLQRISRGL